MRTSGCRTSPPDRLAVAGDDVEDARGEDVGGQLRKAQRRERRLLGRLQDQVLPAASAGANFQTAIISG